jgi:hypothetical protein
MEEEKESLTRRPGAYLASMARQCPRGRPGAAEGRLHRGAPGAPHLALPPAKAREAQAHEHAQQLSKLQRRGTAQECSGAADLERGGPPDLLGEEAAGESFRWSW